MKKNRGFTLIELMVTLAVIVVLAGVFFPRIGNLFPTTQLKTSGRHLATTIRYLANQAILKGSSYRLYIDPKTNSYWTTSKKSGAETEISGRLLRKRRLPAGIEFKKFEQPVPFEPEKATPYIEFLASGEVEQTLIVITSADLSRKLNLLVYPYGGRTQITIGETDETVL